MKQIESLIVNRLVQPTYQNRLRIIGRHLDLGGYRSMMIMEIPGGFLVRAMGPGGRIPEALEFPSETFVNLMTHAIHARGESKVQRGQHPLLPTGYEDFLRALGHLLDEQQTEALTVAEGVDFVAAGGLAIVQGYARTGLSPFQRVMRADTISGMLDEAFRRRSPELKKGTLVGRLMGR